MIARTRTSGVERFEFTSQQTGRGWRLEVRRDLHAARLFGDFADGAGWTFDGAIEFDGDELLSSLTGPVFFSADERDWLTVIWRDVFGAELMLPIFTELQVLMESATGMDSGEMVAALEEKRRQLAGDRR